MMAQAQIAMDEVRYAIGRLAEHFSPTMAPSLTQAEACLGDMSEDYAGLNDPLLIVSAYNSYLDLSLLESEWLDGDALGEPEVVDEYHPTAQQLERYHAATALMPAQVREEVRQHLGPCVTCQRRPRPLVLQREEHTFVFPQEPRAGRDLPLDLHRELLTSGFPVGCGPTEHALQRMRAEDLIFVCLLRGSDARLQPIALVHARICAAGSDLAVEALLGQPAAPPAEGAFPTYRLERPTALCHTAVTSPPFRTHGVTQTLIQRIVLPYLAQSERTRHLARMTSSPLTYMVGAGRALVRSSDFPKLVRWCEGWFNALELPHAPSLRVLAQRAQSYLDELGFGVGLQRPSAAASYLGHEELGVFLWALFHALPAQEELDAARRQGGSLPCDAQQRMTRLYQPARGARDPDFRAAVFMLTLAAALTQVGVWSNEDGKLVENIARFHLSNGGLLHPHIGPFWNSRPGDIAALGMGQAIVYQDDHEEQRARFRQESRQRARGARGYSIDMDGIERIGRVVSPLAAQLLRHAPLEARGSLPG